MKFVHRALALMGRLARSVMSSPFQTYPLDSRSRRQVPRARFFGNGSVRQPSGPRPEGSARLYGPLRTFRHISGRDPVATLAPSPRDFRWLWSWAEVAPARTFSGLDTAGGCSVRTDRRRGSGVAAEQLVLGAALIEQRLGLF